MGRSLRQKLVALAVAPALLLSGAAQALLVYRCDGMAARVSCSCPHDESDAPAAKLESAKRQCCAAAGAPAPAPQEVAQPVLHAAPVAMALPSSAAPPCLRMQHAPPAALAAAPPGPSLVIANRALLI